MHLQSEFLSLFLKINQIVTSLNLLLWQKNTKNRSFKSLPKDML